MPGWRSALRAYLRDYEWIHLTTGLFGNLSFFAGSVSLLTGTWAWAGAWLFIVGSLGMLVGTLGGFLDRYLRHRRRWNMPLTDS